MNVLILNAGKGVRFFGSSFSRNQAKTDENTGQKCLLKLNGETILDRQIRLLNMAGIVDITIAIDSKTGQKVKDILIEKDVKIIEVTCYRENYEKNWTLFQCKHLFSEGTLVLNGDIIFSETIIQKVLSFFNQKIDNIIFIGQMPNRQLDIEYAIPPYRNEIYMFIMNKDGADFLKDVPNPFGGAICPYCEKSHHGMLWEDTKFWELYNFIFKGKVKSLFKLENIQDVDFPEDLEYWKKENSK